ncbi:sepiapterin reductase-like [Dendronephthya gigantea]|uniref:sepiapterin reductase-like n=1 Tax=Dendronephthya gigantea TaxID=151771 RepID=UPI00106BC06C|nr:sepiapterin reductase-like [Dendronephthya gigantea]
MPSLAFYCAGKAARDMFNQVLSQESRDTRVLNYGPGRMKTEMFHDILSNTDCEDTREKYTQLREQNMVVEPRTSADKLVLMLKQDRYKSGDHIEFLDRMP